MLYRCTNCKKPLTLIDVQLVNIDENRFLVTKCCNSFNFFELNADTLIEIVNGKRRKTTRLSDGEIHEFVLQWAKDFAEMNERVE